VIEERNIFIFFTKGGKRTLAKLKILSRVGVG
jgi:hypothetical protein